MYPLARVFPKLGGLRLPLSRDQLALLLAAANEVFLGIDIYLAHSISGTIVVREWIPILFGPAAAALLLVAGLVALRRRAMAALFANAVFLGSAVVGILGVWYHLERAALPPGADVARISTRLLVWGPPFLGPLMFLLVALWGISAAWVEDPPESGRLRFFGRRRLSLPLSKTRVYFLLTGSAAMIATVSAVFDHARTGWENLLLWIPTVTGVFVAVISLAIAAIPSPRRTDYIVYLSAMLLLIVTGLLGAWFHVDDNLTSRGVFVAERFIRGAPVMAPLLFTNVGLLGLVSMLDPRERDAEPAENPPPGVPA